MIDLEKEIDHLRKTCINCGKCTAVCPSLKHGGFDPKEMMVAGVGDITLCIQCGKCSQVCFRTDPFRVMRDCLALYKEEHPNENYQRYRFILPPAEEQMEPGWNGDDVCVIPGCVVESRLPYLKYACRVALDSIGKRSHQISDNQCCMMPSMFSELGEMGRRPVRTMMVRGEKGDLVALCAGCASEFRHDGTEVKHLLEYLFENIDSLPVSPKSYKVAIEPGCSMDRHYKQMKAVVEKMGFTIVNETYGCCGSKKPPLNTMLKEREEECADSDFIVLNCPFCMTKYEKFEGGKPCMHIAELVAFAAGDSTTLGLHNIPLKL